MNGQKKSRKNKLVAPFLKWVGGKRQLANQIVEMLPSNYRELNYVEPFIGGGAILFHLQPKNAIINDLNEELINVYNVIKNNLDALISDLKKHENSSDYFYEIRSLDRNENFKNLSEVERASRVIYLNKTCYNGLYRVNNAGEFNSPYGKYKKPNIVNEPVLKAVSKYLNLNNISIYNKDYSKVLNEIPENSFVYLDPPYHPISDSSNFTGYIKGGWDVFDQIKLKDICEELDARGIKFLLSNSSADLIKELYAHYDICKVKANRAVNSNASRRGEVEELLIKNY
ncbi:DNA adenine methylase [Ornithobacterium rhinotracheale]